MDRPYQKDPSYFDNDGLLDVTKKLKSMKCYDVNIFTKEKLDCEKVHINVLTVSKYDLLKFHEKKFKNKYIMWVQKVRYIQRQTVLEYITKEAKKRPFYRGDDYLIYINVRAKPGGAGGRTGGEDNFPEGILKLF